jgi:hypothetical protein
VNTSTTFTDFHRLIALMLRQLLAHRGASFKNEADSSAADSEAGLLALLTALSTDATSLATIGQEVSEVLALWHHRPEFLDDSGDPIALPMHGPLSLESLCRIANTSLSPSSIAHDLTHNSLAEQTRDGHIRPLSRVHVTSGDARLECALRLLVDCMLTIRRNLDASDASERTFHNCAYMQVPRSQVHALEAYLRKRGREYLVSIDDWCLNARRRAAESEPLVCVDLNVFSTAHASSSTLNSRAVDPNKRKVAKDSSNVLPINQNIQLPF